MSPPKDLGTRHTCWNCGAKFYDLKKPEPSCPKCGSDPRNAPVVKEPARPAKKAAAAPEPARSIDDEQEDDRRLDDEDDFDDAGTVDFGGDDDDDVEEDDDI